MESIARQDVKGRIPFRLPYDESPVGRASSPEVDRVRAKLNTPPVGVTVKSALPESSHV